MTIVDIRQDEDCFDDSMMYELVFDEPAREEHITSLQSLGDLEYFSQFPRPFYRLTVGNRYVLKGVLAGETAKLILFRGEPQPVAAEIQGCFNGLADSCG